MQLGLCSRRRGDPMPSRYYTSCIGCQSSSGSYKLAVLNWRYKVRNMSTPVFLFVRIAERFCNVLYVYCHPAAGATVHDDTLLACFPVFTTVCSVWNSLPQTVLISDWLFWNPDLKLCSIRLSLNTDRPAACEVTTIWRNRNLIIPIIYLTFFNLPRPATTTTTTTTATA